MSLTNSACFFILPVALHLTELSRDFSVRLVLSQCPVGASARRCHSIYKGFAQCLMSLGDSLTEGPRPDDDAHGLHSICRSWDQFHACANRAMSGCPDEAAVVWESLRRESKKMQFSGNLYDMCSHRAAAPPPADSASASVRGPPPAAAAAAPHDVNQESLRGHAPHAAGPAHYLGLLPLLVLLLSWI